jgi:outer membrane immunogenic protein
MRTKLALLATTTLAALAIATPAQAAGSWYLSLTGGANWLNDNSFTGTTTVDPDSFTFASESDTGYVIAGAVGLSLGQMMQGLRIEAEVGYRQNQVDGVWASDEDVGAAPIPDFGTADYDHTTLSVMANVWYDFSAGSFKPYIGGGLGWVDVEVDGTYTAAVLADTPFSFSDSGFAWQLGGGVNFQVAPSVQLGVGYRYMAGPEVTVLAPDPNNLATGEVDSQNHSAVVSLTFGM